MGNLVFQATLGGQVSLVGPNTASTFNINVPAVAGNMVTTGDTGTVTNTMLASSAYTAPGTIGSGTANTGAFTTLTASSTITGTKLIPTGTSVTGNGMYLPATNSVGISTAGVNAVYIDASQNVGVGVTPSAKFNIGSGGAARFNRSDNATYGEIVYGGAGVGMKYSDANSDGHRFFNGATQAMTLDASGNLGIGTTGVTGKRVAAVIGNTSSDSVLYGGSGSTYTGTIIEGVSATAASTSWLFLVGKASSTSATVYIFGNGNIQNTNNSYGAISDIKLKENIVDATPKLADLMQVKVRNYNLKGDYEQHKQIGVVAQELETVFPSMIEETADYEDVLTTDAEGNETTERVATGTTTKAVKYSVFVPMLIKAIQEQQALITQLQADVAALKV